jgi:hypothetical protein
MTVLGGKETSGFGGQRNIWFWGKETTGFGAKKPLVLGQRNHWFWGNRNMWPGERKTRKDQKSHRLLEKTLLLETGPYIFYDVRRTVH